MGEITVDTTRPFKAAMPAVNLAPTDDVVSFIAEYADCTAFVKDPVAAFVRSISFHELLLWWKAESTEGIASARAGHVVHWPVANNQASSALLRIFSEVTGYLTSLHPELTCLLDRYRHWRIPAYSWAIVGPTGLCVRPHQDMFGTASWNLLTLGRKRWRFWSPTTQSPDQNMPSLTMTQKVGELVWIPENWWHAVAYDEPSICLTKNLVLARSFQAIRYATEWAEPELAILLRAIATMRAKETVR